MLKHIFLLFLTLLITIHVANSQRYLLLKNGDRVEFKKNSLSASNTEVKIKSVAKGKLKFRPEEVVGYYSQTYEVTFYLKPEVDDSGQLTYVFIEKILGGEINLYKMFIPGHPGTQYSAGSAPQTYLYLEKAGDFRPLGLIEFHFIGNKKDKNNRTEILKLFVSDKPDLVAAIEGEDFKSNEEGISQIVRNYNLSKYKPSENSANSLSSVFFFIKGKVTQPVKLILNENVEYDLSPKGFTPINVPVNQFNKVCVNSHCEILESSKWYVTYFGIDINEKKSKIEFIRATSLGAKSYLTRKYEWEKEIE